MKDLTNILRTYLLTKSSITDVIGTRISSPRLIKDSPLPAVVIRKVGSEHHEVMTGFYRTDFEIRAWSDDPIVASSTYGLVYDALANLQQEVEVGSGDFILATEQLVGMTDIVDLDSKLFYTFGTWRITMI